MPQAAPLSAGGWGGTTYRDGRAEPRVKRAATRSGRDGVDTRKGQDGSGGWGAARSALCARCCCALTAAVHAARRSECPQNGNGRESSSTRRRRRASRGAPATIFHRRSRPCPSARMSRELCTLPLAGHSRLAGNAPPQGVNNAAVRWRDRRRGAQMNICSVGTLVSARAQRLALEGCMCNGRQLATSAEIALGKCPRAAALPRN